MEVRLRRVVRVEIERPRRAEPDVRGPVRKRQDLEPPHLVESHRTQISSTRIPALEVEGVNREHELVVSGWTTSPGGTRETERDQYGHKRTQQLPHRSAPLRRRQSNCRRYLYTLNAPAAT